MTGIVGRTGSSSGAVGTMTALPGEVGNFKSTQVFNSTGTWTRPAGITTIKVYVTGAGGGGGAPGTTPMSGGGGAAGGTAIENIDVSAISSVIATIGIGGTGSSNVNPAPTGGSSSFGTHCSATGGIGGNRGGGIGGTSNGGVGSGGDINLAGNAGGCGFDSTFSIGGGMAGGSFWGGAGYGQYSNHGKVGNNGSGGGGAQNSSYTGGAGGNGFIVVEEYS